MKGPAEAVKLLSNIVAVDMPPQRLNLVLVDIILNQGWEEDDTAAELAEKWLDRFRKYIEREINNSIEDSSFLNFSFNSAGTDYIQGACYIEPHDKIDSQIAKQRRANFFKYHQELKRVNPVEFEILCGKFIGLLKVDNPIVTRSSADQGIDFFGQIPFGELIQPTAITPGAEKQLKIWLVGQAKHYDSTQVSTSDIRELVGSVSLAKSKAYAGAKDPLAELQIRNCDPVFYLFFTTGNISRDARDLLKKAGVVAMDGMQLAVFLADNDVATVDAQFDQSAFESWMAS